MERPTVQELSFLRDMNTVFRLLSNYGARCIKDSGVTIAQAQMLIHLSYYPDSSLESISKELHMAKSAVRLTLNQLVEGQYLRRVPDARDKRIFHFVMLEKGTVLLPRFYQVLMELNDQALLTLTEYERIVFIGLLDKVKQQVLNKFDDR